MISGLPERIFLCGFMGAGKSVIGRKLAKELELSFLDLDDKIEEQAGQSIPEIFEESGESAFRVAERRALQEVIKEFEGVVSLGGGSLQNQYIVDHLKLNGLLIFIEAPISVILDRISQDDNRPLLLDEHGNPKSKKKLENELTALYEERLPLYEQAVIQIQNDGKKSVEDIVEKLLKKIRNHVEYY
ncbi:shikimate kinase [Fodinibius sp.]|uniref:shikimate kinase n=1 Tax=Fodinibius sp. TaxID=1872440 RepID=UPI002ACD8B1D|nr:shikimate kinase [Fodinibius sp.]MDZ7659710.1 shikimate kinase [Fodinibius sp.]